jgi:two-component system chemotaxis sensor kinase CheA
MSELDNVVKEFLVESYENLDQLDRDLVALEKDPANRDRLASIFRTIHTIKGTCGFFGFGKLESVSHVGENLLSRLRDGLLTLDAERTNSLLAMIDAVRGMLASIEATGSDGDGDYSGLIATLTRLQEADAPKVAPEPPAAAPAAAAAGEAPTPAPEAAAKPARKRAPRKRAAKAEPAAQPAEGPAADAPPAADPVPGAQSSVPAPAAPADVKPQPAAEAAEHKPAAPPAETKGHAVADTNIRVDVGLLDKLMNLVGELVLARNQVLQYTATQKDASFLGTSQRLNLITTELQEGVMKTRMQPIGNVWDRFPRIVRDLALACGKQVRIEMEGKETELDKTIIEAIKDPLTHIVRNSVDHGIESPEKRVAAGKQAEGTLFLRAFHEGGQVNIEISDDGGGINAERVKAKALEKGLISREQAARLGEREMVNLVFLPGFSTAEKITNVSGRGVGMDVVKTNIEKIGGTVDIQSRPGLGTTLKIKIPLTLAIIPALVVTSGGDRYAIPQVSLLELVRLDGEQARKGIERIHGAPVYRLRGNLLPLVYLERELLVEADSRRGDVVNIVVLQADDRQFGLVVDGINDTEEIVVKPLGKQFKGIPLFAGATIMGDGRVALILDVLGIAQRAHVISEVRDRALTDAKSSRPQEGGAAVQTLLVLSLGEQRRLAVPLSLVARLEEVAANDVEHADGREVIQYRGQIMPLLRLADVFGGPGQGDGETMHVVVYTEGGQSVGLVVGRILDIVETAVDLRQVSHRHGLLGTAVIQGRVTDLVDVPAVVREAGVFEQPAAV